MSPDRQTAWKFPDYHSASAPHPAGHIERLNHDPAVLTDRQLTDLLTSPLARCNGPGMDPDAWYPVAQGRRARVQVAQAIAVCNQCPVRVACLEMSMRQWATGGQHGIWGGLLEPDRVTVYTAWRAGKPITGLPTKGAVGHSVLNRRAARSQDLLTGERARPEPQQTPLTTCASADEATRPVHGQGE